MISRKKSVKQEKMVAKKFQGRTTIASGALYFQKSDVRNDTFLVECKTTEKDYYSLTEKVWLKNKHEAIRDGMRKPMMCIQLMDKHDLVVMSNDDFRELGLYPEFRETGNIVTSNSSFRVKIEMVFSLKQGFDFNLPLEYVCTK